MLIENKNFEDLMTDYFSGSISGLDQQRLSDLLKSNEEYKASFDEMIKLRAVSFVPIIEAEKKANYQLLMEKINEKPSFNRSRSWMTQLGRIAAIIVFAVSISVSSYYVYRDISSPDDSLICYETIVPIGSQTKVILPDSTVVWLNSGSSLKYYQSFDKKERDVKLVGEGYFEVKKDQNKPFIVQTTWLDVKVLGTTFNVSSYEEDPDVEVNLIEGRVDVTLPQLKNIGSKTMLPNDKLVFNKLTKKISTSQTEANKSALWTRGKLCFVDATIEQITKDLERKYDVKIQIASENIKQEIFSGSLNLNLSLKENLSYIDVDKKFVVNQVGDTIRISSK